jgi:hypothetical protein
LYIFLGNFYTATAYVCKFTRPLANEICI